MYPGCDEQEKINDGTTIFADIIQIYGIGSYYGRFFGHRQGLCRPVCEEWVQADPECTPGTEVE
jgi:hypothetical protein